MTLISQKSIRISVMLPILVLILLTHLCGPSHGVEAVGVIINIEGSGGSLTRGDTGVRFTVKTGDTLLEGDRVNLGFGSKLMLSFDEAGLDVMEFQGPCAIRLVSQSQIELSQGGATVILDNRKAYRSVQIKTPSATATGRDAHFQVEINQQKSEVRSYKSQVQVQGVDSLGVEIGPAVMLNPGQKTSVPEPGVAPDPTPEPMTKKDLKGMEVIQEKIGRSLNWVKGQTDNWLKNRFHETSGENLKGSQGTTREGSAQPPASNLKIKDKTKGTKYIL